MLVLCHLRMSIASFSPELLTLVFSFLPRITSDPFDSDFSALANALLVCRLWRQVSSLFILIIFMINLILSHLHSHHQSRYTISSVIQVGESPVLWRESKLMVTSTEVLAAFCEGDLPARFHHFLSH